MVIIICCATSHADTNSSNKTKQNKNIINNICNIGIKTKPLVECR